MNKLALTAVLFGWAVAVPAAADETADRADLRCVIVTGMAGAQATNPDMKMGLASGVSYFMGKLKGRDAAFDLSARLAAEVRTIKVPELKADFVRCGQELKVFGAEAKAAGAALQAIGAASKTGAPD